MIFDAAPFVYTIMFSGFHSNRSQLSLSEHVSVTVEPSVDTPTRTVRGFEVSSSGRINPGDILTATITAPSDQDYVVEVRDIDENIVSFTQEFSGDTTIDFDSSNMPGGAGDSGGELGPGTYAVAPVDNGTLLGVAPFIIQAYDTTTYVQEVIESGDDLPASAELSALPEADNVQIDGVEFVVWEDGGSGTRYQMSLTEALTYERLQTKLPATDFKVQTGVLTPAPEADNADSQLVGISAAHTVTDAVDTLQYQGASDGGGEPQFSTPAVGTDRVFVGGLDSRVVAVPADGVATGADASWTFDRNGSLVDSSPTLANGTLYIGSGAGVLYALTAGTDDTTGNVEWTYPSDVSAGESALTSSPLVVGGVVYIGANDGTVSAIDAGSGTVQWSTDVGGPIHSQPAYGSGYVFVTTADGQLVAVDEQTEAVAWTYDANGRFGSSGPVVDSGTVYVAADDLYAFDVAGETPTWTAASYGGTIGSTPVVHDGRVYVGSGDKHLYAIEDDGTVAWTYETRDAIASTPTIVDGRAVVGSLDGSIYVFDGVSGDLRTAEYLGTPIYSSPAEAAGTVYLEIPAETAGAGDVAALDINQL